MGSPVQGGDGGVEPSWRDLFDNRADSSSEGEDADLNQRITEHVSSVFGPHTELGIPQASPSSEMSNDLPERLAAGPREEEFFRSLLQRIQRAVFRIWSSRSKILKEESTPSYRALFENTEIDESIVSEVQDAPPPARGCLASIRQFFLNAFRRMCSCIYKKKSESTIDFCGLDAESPEGTIALALLLRMASKWALETGFSSLDRKSQHPKSIFPLQSTGEFRKIVTVFQEFIQRQPSGDPLTIARGIAKLVCALSSQRGECQKAVESLSRKDPSRDYSEIILGAKQLDILASKGNEGLITVRQILTSLCVTYNQLLGEFLSSWGDVNEENPTEIRYDFVVQVVETNLPVLQEAYTSDPQLYERMLNDAICRFFFVPQIKEDEWSPT
ncbi:hypothetical protein [Chlamydia avium]|uniref:Uncharacterized protein n=1 Tax=Chlamydia avium 10DC88 TaxID=1229831 RepID=W8JN70_9CHLA|nr:hypothetical protein [Chlamydia avium]AHK63714.1 Uncharacterized protein M832_08650 [Chlamydia avium 10DC88]